MVDHRGDSRRRPAGGVETDAACARVDDTLQMSWATASKQGMAGAPLPWSRRGQYQLSHDHIDQPPEFVLRHRATHLSTSRFLGGMIVPPIDDQSPPVRNPTLRRADSKACRRA